MELLIDGDIIAYRASASAENEEEHIALSRVHDLMHGVLGAVEHTDFRTYLTGGGNFRKKLYPLYKANRTQPKPKWLSACREQLVMAYSARIVDGIEADDAIGINMTLNTVCCSIDKDLKQFAGWHYNFVTGALEEISDYEADYNFYAQFLIGDRSDNIEGVRGIGVKKAYGILYGKTHDEMFDTVRELYNDDKRFLLNGQLLHIFRHKDDLWLPKKLEYLWFGTDPSKVVEDARSEYYQQISEETSLLPAAITVTESGTSANGHPMESLPASISNTTIMKAD